MGMTEKEFGEMGITTFFLKLFYFNKRKDADSRLMADLIRSQTYFLVNLQLSEQNKFKNPQQMWRFPWEEDENRPKPMTKEQLSELVLKANKIFSGI